MAPGPAGFGVKLIERAVRAAAGELPIASLSIAMVDDASMSALHEQFMNDPSPTDVLTFDLRDDEDADGLDGEIVVSVDTARREAARRGLEPREELLRYVIHGVLHLVGLNDHTPSDRRRMRSAEDSVLVGLNLRATATAGPAVKPIKSAATKKPRARR